MDDTMMEKSRFPLIEADLIYPESSTPDNQDNQSSTALPYYSELYEVTPGGVVILSILYGSISVVTIIGNTLIILVIVKNRAMHNVTNFFIANLSVADVIVGMFSIPFQFQAALLQRWNLPDVFCPLAPFVKELSVNVSVLTLVVISVDRFFAVIHPLRRCFTRRMAQVVMSLVWVFSLISSAPSAAVFRVILVPEHSRPEESSNNLASIYHDFKFEDGELLIKRCEAVFPQMLGGLVDSSKVYRLYLVFIQYFLPLCAISYAYSRIVHRIWSLKAPGNIVDSRDQTRNKNKRKVIKMLIVVVVLFSCCWLPIQTYNFISEIWPEINLYKYINVIWFAFNWLAMSNSCYNPFIYGLLNEKFKRGFIRLFRTCLCLPPDTRTDFDRVFTTTDTYRRRSTLNNTPDTPTCCCYTLYSRLPTGGVSNLIQAASPSNARRSASNTVSSKRPSPSSVAISVNSLPGHIVSANTVAVMSENVTTF